MRLKPWLPQIALLVLFLGLAFLLLIWWQAERKAQQDARAEDWEYVVADLIDSNARLREEIEALEAQLAELDDVDGRGMVLESLVDEVNYLRIANGLVTVSGPGVVVSVSGPISVLDLHDLINELRNAGAEALALNDERIVAWSAIATDGQYVTVDGLPVQPPYYLKAIGDGHTLKVALMRSGGLVEMLARADRDVEISVDQVAKLTLPVYSMSLPFTYARVSE